ncbi:xanthine dehydrogenase [bacterium 1XD42-1]|nr:xanthine dehydrogenase [bacterium 1XD42-8]RKJ63728.1 xanthine dehydrogenase [bacterium 1XD42-1]
MKEKNYFFTQLKDTLKQGHSIMLMTSLGSRKGAMAFQKENTLIVSDEDLRPQWEKIASLMPPVMPQILETGNTPVLYERVSARPKLILCGGGHVAQSTAVLGKMLDFEVTVIDNRREFANEERFPGCRILCMPYAEALKQIKSGNDTYFVIVTPGHIADQECLESILQKDQPVYIGMISSRRKADLTRETLEPVFGTEKIAQIHMPIGLPIGGSSPAEIAVSIAAQLIQTRSNRENAFNQEGLEELASGTPMILCTVIKKNGSAPRGVGTRLMIDKDGKTYGTIGGGAAEAAVLNAAPKVLEKGVARFMEFTMQNDDIQKEDMVCGGSITVLMEPVN